VLIEQPARPIDSREQPFIKANPDDYQTSLESTTLHVDQFNAEWLQLLSSNWQNYPMHICARISFSHIAFTEIMYLSIAAMREMQSNLRDDSGLLRMLLRQGSTKDPSPNLPQSKAQDFNGTVRRSMTNMDTIYRVLGKLSQNY
jgi:hypothetical protein